MKFLGSKYALPVALSIATFTLVGVQAMALSQPTDPSPESEISLSTPAADSTTESANDSNPATTPMVIPTDGPTALPSDDDDEFEDEDGEFEDEDDADEFDDDGEFEGEDEGDDD